MQEEVVIKVKKKRRKHYINNEDMNNALVIWKNMLIEKPETPIPDYIGECFIKIAENRAKHPWYAGWSFKDEMIAEAVLTCVKYCRNYDPTKTTNCFSYFTQFVNNAFEQVKLKEKKLADYRFEQVKEMQNNSDQYDYNNFFNEDD